MREAWLSAVDLNLLLVLVEVIGTGSVKEAARRQAITPSAVSHALARLRERLGDPLVVRTPTGMQATPAALRLVEAARPALLQLEQALRSVADFDPLSLDTTFRIGAASFGTAMLAPALISRLATLAPRVRLRCSPLPVAPEEALARDLDAMIGVQPLSGASTLYRRRLFRERWMCMVHEDHPHAGARMSLQEYAGYQHVVIAPRGRVGGPIDELLASHGLRRDVVVMLDDFLAAPAVVAETRLVLTAGARFLRRGREGLPVRLVELDAELPGFEVSLVWHERVHEEPAHRWLRELVVGVSQEVYVGADGPGGVDRGQ